MRIIFLLLILILHTRVSALSADVKTTADFAKPSLLTLAEFQQTFQDNGYLSVDGYNDGASSVLGVDQVFVDSEQRETIFLKLGLQQFPLSSFNKISGGIAYQGVYRSVPYVLFFDQVAGDRARQLVDQIVKSKAKSAKSMLLDLLIPKAQAAPACGTSAFVNGAGAVLHTVDEVFGFTKLATCALTVLKTTRATVEAPIASLFTMVTDPVKFWNDTKRDWQNLKSFVLNIRSELKEAFQGLAGMTPEIMDQVACTLIGHAAGAAALTALTGGLGVGAAAKTAAAIALVIAKLNRLKFALLAMSFGKRAAHVGNLSKLTEQVMSCAVH